MTNKVKFLEFVIILSGLTFFACEKDQSPLVPSRDTFWQISSPEAQGLNYSFLKQAAQEAEQSGFVNSLLVIKNDYLVFEQYFNGMNARSAQNVMSVSKSFLSAMVGIAIQKGLLRGVDQKIEPFFPEYSNLFAHTEKHDITIGHLLTMHAGFDKDTNVFFDIYYSDNWVKTTLEQSLIYNPGEQFSYNTFATHLLSVILTKASGKTSLQFAEDYLSRPLNIHLRNWEKDPQEYYFGGTNMYFTARDLAKFGLLYLKNGFLENQQIVPADWVNRSLVDYSGFHNLTWGVLEQVGYGYLWWLGRIKGHRTFLALGHGGQYILCLPELKLIIVTTSNGNVDWDTADEQERWILEMVGRNILNMVEE